ncbi:MAG: hypothetical protein NTV88_05580, partial [Candidatus Micrarchaeota archaeon]|nr:hypothetical protein [Candidatus Micrarchaeota archaeon]
HRIRNVIGSVYATANYSMNGSASYIFPVDMPKTGDKEYVLRLTEAKMAQMGWLSGIWNAIVKSDYIGELKKFGYANGDEEAHMKKCFTALPGAMKRLGAAATAREVKYDDVASVSGSTYVLCYSVLDMDIELYGPAGSKAREIVSYLKATLYDNNKLFELFNSALLENTPNLRREQLEGWVLQRPGGVYYLNTKELAKNSIFRKNNDKFKVRQVANLAGHIYELSTFISEE